MDADVMEMQPVTVVEAITKGEVDMQVATAKRHPRNIKKSQDAAISMACVDEDTASSCMYALPRAGKKIEGGSIRLAEIVSSTYGNLRVQSRIIDDPSDTKHVTAMASAWDLESNTAVSLEKKRKATNKNGQRYNDDMIVTTSNANCSIAFRDAVFKVVPRAYWQPIYEAARKVAIGDASTLSERRTKMVGYFAKLGVFEETLLANLGRESVEGITLDDLEKLHGAASLIKEGQTTVDEAFPPLEPDKEKTSITDRAKAKAAEKKKPAPPPAQASKEHIIAETCEPPRPAPPANEAATLVKEITGMGVSTDVMLAACNNHGVKILKGCKDVEKLKSIALDLHEIAGAPAGT